MGRRRMKTNGDEKETHLAETTATYALGVFCQLVNPYISGVDHHKKGFMKDFWPFAVWCGWVCQVVTVLRSSLPQVR